MKKQLSSPTSFSAVSLWIQRNNQRLLFWYALCLSSLVVCLPGAGRAQESQVDRVNLQSAVRRALDHNYDLASARLEVERADAQVDEAWGTALPRLDLGARYTRALKKPVFFLPDFANPGSNKVVPIEIGSTHAFDVNFSASQVLFNANVFIGLGAAKTYSKAARELYRAKESETIASAEKAFYGVVVGREAVELMRQTMTNAEENLKNTRMMTSQGLVSEYDQLRAEVAVENLRPELLNAENGYQLALNTLKFVIGLPYDQPLEVDGTLEFVPVDAEVIAAAQGTVLQTNPSFAGVKLKSDINDAMVSAERSGYLPVISAFGTYQYVNQSNQFKVAVGDFIAASTIGLSLSMNIFNGFQTVARVDQAELEYRKSQEDVAKLSQSLHTATEATLLQLAKSRQRIESQGRTVDQAERGYRIASTRYTSGLATLLEVNDALLALTRAKVNKIQAVYDYTVASADLDQLLGRVPSYLQHNEGQTK